ncbi:MULTISPECIES: hypothetical protein [Vibrio]|uniref:hypothetical protein n=1 Tax=Vibrio TaxID=662 RepID=UPI0012FE6EC5|nr:MULTISPECIES: hypothetical protein [Vibrio]
MTRVPTLVTATKDSALAKVLTQFLKNIIDPPLGGFLLSGRHSQISRTPAG